MAIESYCAALESYCAALESYCAALESYSAGLESYCAGLAVAGVLSLGRARFVMAWSTTSCSLTKPSGHSMNESTESWVYHNERGFNQNVEAIPCPNSLNVSSASHCNFFQSFLFNVRVSPKVALTVYMYIYTKTYTYTYTRMHTHKHKQIHTLAHKRTHTQIVTYTPTQTQTHTST